MPEPEDDLEDVERPLLFLGAGIVMSVSSAICAAFAAWQAIASNGETLGWLLVTVTFALVCYAVTLFMHTFGYRSRDIARALGLTYRPFLHAGVHRRPHRVAPATPLHHDNSDEAADAD
jgi:hypothetical protein